MVSQRNEKSKNKRIAIVGTFDVENYGDLLFPIIAEKKLREQGWDLTIVTPTGNEVSYSDCKKGISIEEWAKNINDYHALIIGGGNLIHWNDWGKDIDGYNEDTYRNIWINTSEIAKRNSIPVLWNAPGAMNPRDRKKYIERAIHSIKSCEYISLRDGYSARVIKEWTGKDAYVVPDTANEIENLWSKKELEQEYEKIKNNIRTNEGQILISVHCKRRSIQEMGEDKFTALLKRKLEETNSKALLLALGRCHDDHIVNQQIKEKIPDNSIDLSELTSLKQIATIIACSKAYIGSSLHGEITACNYGTPSRLVANNGLHKYEGQTIFLNNNVNIVNNWEEAIESIPWLLQSKTPEANPNMKKILEQHWKKIIDIIEEGSMHLNKRDRDSNVEIEKKTEHKEQIDPTGDANVEYRIRIDQLLNENRLDEAMEETEIELKKDKDSSKANMSKLKILIRQNKLELALIESKKILKRLNKNPWICKLRFECLNEAGRPEEAFNEFEEYYDNGRWESKELYAVIREVMRKRSVDDQYKLLKDLNQKHENVWTFEIALAMRAYQAHDHEFAFELFEKARKKEKLPDFAIRVLRKIEYVEAMSIEREAVEAKEKLKARKEELTFTDECRLSRFNAMEGNFKQAITRIKSAIMRRPGEMQGLYIANRIFMSKKDESEILTMAVEHEKNNTTQPSWTLQLALFSLKMGKVEYAKNKLKSLLNVDSEKGSAREIIEMIDYISHEDIEDRILEGNQNISINKCEDAKATLIVFGNFLGAAGYLPFYLSKRLLQGRQINTIYLRDPYSLNYRKGIPGYGKNIEDFIEAIGKVCNTLEATKLITLGVSASAYVGLKFAIKHQATHHFSLAGLYKPDSIRIGGQKRIKRQHKGLFGEPIEYEEVYEQVVSKSSPKVVHFIGDSFRPDIERAESLKSPNCNVVKIENVASHNVIMRAVTSGLLMRELDRALETNEINYE
uniref:polysaccharide pyruvyl transferase family protein n=1 Tax=Synechococcus sp. UW106 TaxID=368495 RepID=UPI000E0F7D62|nr:polysaccharide pyruvyl transferase family protein [Synechococcus sp. UW106]